MMSVNRKSEMNVRALYGVPGLEPGFFPGDALAVGADEPINRESAVLAWKAWKAGCTIVALVITLVITCFGAVLMVTSSSCSAPKLRPDTDMVAAWWHSSPSCALPWHIFPGPSRVSMFARPPFSGPRGASAGQPVPLTEGR